MSTPFILSDIVYDGADLEATLDGQERIFVRVTSFRRNADATGGVISGTLVDGPERFINKLAQIAFLESSGTCRFLP